MASQKVKASTQGHLDIDDITEDFIILKNGNAAMIMSTTAINFDILSEAEQDATIYAYGALLNSLSFPVQILIRSKKADISAYFQHLSEALDSQGNPDLKNQIQKYMNFIQSTVQQRTVLDKKFYLIITFSPLELGLKGVKRSSTKAKSKAQLITDAKVTLTPKRDHLTKQTARLGLVTRQLSTKELIELFYDIYNPAPTGTQKTVIDSGGYSSALVEPAVENPIPASTASVEKTVQNLTQSAQINTPSVAPTPQGQPQQQEALKDLQTATNNAKQFIQSNQNTGEQKTNQ